MLDKLFVRVRSWLHNDPAGVGGDPGLPGPVVKADGRGQPPGVTPPPLPPDAWKESESGMVITESGIIIIDPSLLDAGAPARTRGIPEDSAWALPSLPRPGSGTPVPPHLTSPSPAPMSTSATTTTAANRAESLNWDEVLARAKARIATGEHGAVPDSSSSRKSVK